VAGEWVTPYLCSLHARLKSVVPRPREYQATAHFVGQSTVFTLTGSQATGEAHGLAHHVPVNGEKRRLMAPSLRYYDTCVKIDGTWLLAERLLYMDRMDERAVS
jgi:hypothetical protein